MNLADTILMTRMTPLGSVLLSYFLARVNIHTFGPARVIVNKPYLDIKVNTFGTKQDDITLYLGCGHFFALSIRDNEDEDKLYNVMVQLFLREMHNWCKGDEYAWMFI